MTTVTRLKKIAPLQLAKMLAVIYGLLSLVIVPFFILFSVVGAMAGAGARHSSPGAAMMGIGFSVGMAVLMPILYAFFGFIGGLLGAFIYNLVAGWIGGIEVEFEQTP